MLSPPRSRGGGLGVCGFCFSTVIGKSGDFIFHILGGNVTPTPPETVVLRSGLWMQVGGGWVAAVKVDFLFLFHGSKLLC